MIFGGVLALGICTERNVRILIMLRGRLIWL